MPKMAAVMGWRAEKAGQAWLAAIAGAAAFGTAVYAVAFAAGWHPHPWPFIVGGCGGLAGSGFGRMLQIQGSRNGRRRAQVVDVARGSSDALPEDIVHLALQDKKIQAIKRYRELNPGVGLKQAKDLIDSI
jgi:hypothetical protein